LRVHPNAAVILSRAPMSSSDLLLIAQNIRLSSVLHFARIYADRIV
jgi:hypothetical protein